MSVVAPPGSGSMMGKKSDILNNILNKVNTKLSSYKKFAEQSKDVRDRSNLTYDYFNSKILGRETGSSPWFRSLLSVREKGNSYLVLSFFSVLVIITYIVMYSLYVDSLHRGQTNKKLKNGFQITAYIMLAVLMLNLIESSGAFTLMIVLFITANILVVLWTMWIARKTITKTATSTEVTKTRFITFGLLGVACFPALLFVTSLLIQGTSYFTRVFDPFQNALGFSSVMILTVFSVMGMYFYYWKDNKISETKRKKFYNRMVYVGLGTVVALILMIAVVGFYYAYGKELMVKCIDFESEGNKGYKAVKLSNTPQEQIRTTIVRIKKEKNEISTQKDIQTINTAVADHFEILKKKDAYFSFLKPKYGKYETTIQNMAKEGQSVENMEGKIREDRHLVDSRLIMVKIIFTAAVIFLACWNHYTGWINASKYNKLKFVGLLAFAILTGMLTAVSIILLRSKLKNWAKNLQYNTFLILCFGVLSGVFYILMELSGFNTYLRDIKTTNTVKTTTTTTTTPEPTASTATFGDAQCKAMQSKVMYRTVVIFGIMTCVVAVYALFALLSYSTGLSYVDGFFHRREKLGIFPSSTITNMSTFTELFQNSHIKLGIEAFMFALFMNLVYFLVLLAYNPKSDWMSTEFKEKVMELGLVFVKFFLFYYILVSLRTFHIKQQNPEAIHVQSPNAAQVLLAKAMQVKVIQNVKSPLPQSANAAAPAVVAKAMQVESKQNVKSPLLPTPNAAAQAVGQIPPQSPLSLAVGQIPPQSPLSLAVGQIPPQSPLPVPVV